MRCRHRPPKPGLVRVDVGGGPRSRVEVWELPTEGLRLLRRRDPFAAGDRHLRLADGTGVKGFLVEAYGVEGARDISCFGGWRAFIAAQAKSA